jgi:hypothetical protein
VSYLVEGLCELRLVLETSVALVVNVDHDLEMVRCLPGLIIAVTFLDVVIILYLFLVVDCYQ